MTHEIKWYVKNGNTLDKITTTYVEDNHDITIPQNLVDQYFIRNPNIKFGYWDHTPGKATNNDQFVAYVVYKVTFNAVLINETSRMTYAISEQFVPEHTRPNIPAYPTVPGEYFPGITDAYSRTTVWRQQSGISPSIDDIISPTTFECEYHKNLKITWIAYDINTGAETFIATTDTEYGKPSTVSISEQDVLAVVGNDYNIVKPYQWEPDVTSSNITNNITTYCSIAKRVSVKWIDEVESETLKQVDVGQGTPLIDTSYPTPPERFGWYFTYWDPDNLDNTPTINNDLTVIAHYERRTGVVVFSDNGVEISHEQYNYGDSPNVPDDPEKPGMIFIGWDHVVHEVNARYEEYKAIWKNATDTFKIQFFEDHTRSGEKNIIYTTFVDNGQLPTISFIPCFDDYIYIGISPNLVPAYESAEYELVYRRSNECKITWIDGLDSSNKIIDYTTTGTIPSPIMPWDHTSDTYPSYVFDYWNPDIAQEVTIDTEITANYTIEKHTCTYIDDYTGNVIATMPVFTGSPLSCPTEPNHLDENMVFTHWSYAPYSMAHSDLSVIAYYKKYKYQITWKDSLNAEWSQVSYFEENHTPTHVPPTHDGYKFKQWQPTIQPVTTDTEYTAYYDRISYEVDFYAFDANQTWTVIETKNVNYGDSIQPSDFPIPVSHPTKRFIGWTPESLSDIKEDTVVIAQYEDITHTVKFIDSPDFGSTEIIIRVCQLNTMPEPPSNSDMDKRHVGYKFMGWDPSTIEPATSDKTYVATYKKICTITWTDAESMWTTHTEVLEGSTPLSPPPPDHTDKAMVFMKWEPEIHEAIADGDNNYEAQYEVRTFNITWIDGVSKDTITIDNVTSGDMPLSPTPPDHINDGYKFGAWMPQVTTAIADTSYTATYNKFYKIVWKDMDKFGGNIILSVEPFEGEIPTAPTDATMQNLHPGYRFDGWDPEVEPATEDTFYTAKYTQLFTVTWKDSKTDWTDTTLSVPYGSSVTHDAPPRTKAHEGFAFTGWSEDTDEIIEDLTCTAEYEELDRYTVRFLDYDGTVIQSEYVYDGDIPHKPTDPARTGYAFCGWNPEVGPIDDDTDYRATYKKLHMITWLDSLDPDWIQETEVQDGDMPSAPAAPFHTKYMFDSWTPDISPAHDDATYTAKYTQQYFTVRWIDYDGTVITSATYDHGEIPTQPIDPTRSGYRFDGWTPTPSPVTQDQDYIATYKKIYTIQWMDETGWIDTTTVDEGETPSHDAPPNIPEDKKFDGWDPLPYAAYEDNTYTAIYTERNTYQIYWTDQLDPEWKRRTTVKEGETPSFAAPEHDGYMFDGWKPEIIPATCDTEYTATFHRVFDITWQDRFGWSTTTQVSADAVPVPPAHKCDKEGYVFTGNWEPDIVAATENTTYTAVCELCVMTLTFVNGETGASIFKQRQYGSDFGVAPDPWDMPGYVFKGWNPEFPEKVFNDQQFTALYVKVYNVTFIDTYDNQTITTLSVEDHGDCEFPTAPDHTDVGYKFKQWSPNQLHNITSDITCNAEYERIKFTATFVDAITNEIIDTQSVEWGSTPSVVQHPIHDGYVQDSITPDINVAVYADTTYTLNYKKNDGTHRVQFIDDVTNAVIKTVYVLSNDSVDYPSPPDHTHDNIRYDFVEWDPSEIGPVTADIDCYAKYSRPQWSVEFKNGTTGKSEPLPVWVFDGETVGEHLPEDMTAQGYEFSNWDPDITKPIKSDMTFTAMYNCISAGYCEPVSIPSEIQEKFKNRTITCSQLTGYNGVTIQTSNTVLQLAVAGVQAVVDGILDYIYVHPVENSIETELQNKFNADVNRQKRVYVTACPDKK